MSISKQTGTPITSSTVDRYKLLNKVDDIANRALMSSSFLDEDTIGRIVQDTDRIRLRIDPLSTEGENLQVAPGHQTTVMSDDEIRDLLTKLESDNLGSGRKPISPQEVVDIKKVLAEYTATKKDLEHPAE